MCGIAGFVKFDAGEVDPALAGRMVQTLLHRGPLPEHGELRVGTGEARHQLRGRVLEQTAETVEVGRGLQQLILQFDGFADGKGNVEMNGFVRHGVLEG